MSYDFRSTTVEELAGRVRSREVSAVELAQAAIDRIAELDGPINAFVAVDEELAMRDARAVDAAIASGRDPGPLAGVPIGVKDLEDTAGYRTTKGSYAFASGPPAAGDSVLVARLKAAGCVVVGKTNTPECGAKADTVNELFGATRNPWNLDHSSGGSSGGSSAAIAAGMVPLCTGSDGGGSIRIPSACCGLTGFKTSLGRVPSGGAHAPDWQHLSTRGPMARRLSDVVAVLDTVLGPDPSDLRSLPMPDSPWRAALQDARLPVKVAWSPTLGYATADQEVLDVCRAAIDQLSDMGTEVIELDTVFPEDPIMGFVTMTAAYNARTLGHFEGTDVWEKIDAGLRQMVQMGKAMPAVDLVRAEDLCHELNLRLIDVFRETRVLLTPTIASVAPLSGQLGTINGVPTPNWLGFTYPFNMTRSPAGSVPVGFSSSGVPIGLQVVGPQHGDLVVLRTMAVLEEAFDSGRVAAL